MAIPGNIEVKDTKIILYELENGYGLKIKGRRADLILAMGFVIDSLTRGDEVYEELLYDMLEKAVRYAKRHRRKNKLEVDFDE